MPARRLPVLPESASVLSRRDHTFSDAHPEPKQRSHKPASRWFLRGLRASIRLDLAMNLDFDLDLAVTLELDLDFDLDFDFVQSFDV